MIVEGATGGFSVGWLWVYLWLTGAPAGASGAHLVLLW